MSIAVQQISKVYGSQKAVNNISFKVEKGEIVGFLGPNGAGKSTTMKMITGYIQPSSGSVQVCDITVDKNKNESKQKIGYLPEANPLYLDMYVKEYLQFVAGVHRLTNPAATIEEAINNVGLQREQHKKIGELSKGYKQRVGLAAALLHNPEVLILDEPTSGLDPNQIVEIRNVIKQLGTTKTILFSSHILQEVEALCDRVIIINKGEIVADDTIKNLLAKNNAENEVIVAFQQNVQASLFHTVGSANTINSKTLSFNTTNSDSTKKQILTLALEHNLDIVSINSNKNNSLEELFKTLTK